MDSKYIEYAPPYEMKTNSQKFCLLHPVQGSQQNRVANSSSRAWREGGAQWACDAEQSDLQSYHFLWVTDLCGLEFSHNSGGAPGHTWKPANQP